MSSYKSYLIIFFTLFIFSSCSRTPLSIDEKIFEQEDELILYALEYENMKEYNKSIDIYTELFQKTNRYIYLTKTLVLYIELKDFKKIKELAQKNLNEESLEYENILRIYVISLLNLREYDEAFLNAKILLNNFKNSQNYEIMSNVFYLQKKYEEAVKYSESAYLEDLNTKSLLNLVNILYVYLNEKEKAISYLETHIRLYGDDLTVNYKLLSIYQEQKDIDGIISILKRIYYKYKNDENYNAMMKTNNVLINYLEKKDVSLAIKFLKKENNNPEKLLNLYKKTNQAENALKIIKNIYKKTSNIELLAQIAILEFESAKNKKDVLFSVIKKFEDVLSVLDNHMYQNYLGYILINFDIDVKKGLQYVNKALKKAPSNIAYIDSLAWGQYKLNDCKNAYTNMKKVVDSVGLTDDEIILHWNKIKECKK